MDLSIEHGDFAVRYVSHYQRVIGAHYLLAVDPHLLSLMALAIGEGSGSDGDLPQ